MFNKKLVRNNLRQFEPYNSCYDNDINMEEYENISQIALKIRDTLMSEHYTHSICRCIFQYKIGDNHNFVGQLNTFFRCICHQPVDLCCSPQYGTALWRDILGFHPTPCEELLATPELFFDDFVQETTTFVRFHMDYRFNHMFDVQFRLQFARNCIKHLLCVSKEHEQQNLMSHALEHVFWLQCL